MDTVTFALLGRLPTSVCPEGKLTPEISRRYDLPIIFITIDELQEYLTAMNPALREEAADKPAHRWSGELTFERFRVAVCSVGDLRENGARGLLPVDEFDSGDLHEPG